MLWLDEPMLTHIIVALLLGIVFGIITGLTPGIHINLVATLLLSVSPLLLNYTTVLPLAVFIIAMSITHTFLDAIPSIFLGAPESATALGVLPGHRYLLRGNGYMAVKLTIIGSFFGLLVCSVLFPLFLYLIKASYPYIKGYMAYVLILIVVFMLWRDQKKWWAVLIFMLSGVFGMLVFKIPNFKDPLFPMLSGLFGISTLLYSLQENETLPPQQIQNVIDFDRTIAIKAILSGQFSGWLISLFPGLSSAIAAIISLQITRKLGDHGFMILTGTIGTVNMVLSLATALTIDKARNGSIAVIQELMQLNIKNVIVLLLVSLIASCCAVFLTLYFGRAFCSLLNTVNYKKLCVGIIVFVTVLVLVLSGWIGIVVVTVSTCIGLLPAIVKTTRIHAMGCLLLPVIGYLI